MEFYLVNVNELVLECRIEVIFVKAKVILRVLKFKVF